MHNYVIHGIIITLVYLCDKSSILSMNLCNGSNIFTLAVTMIHLPQGVITDKQRTLATSVHVHITDIIRLQNSLYFCVFKNVYASGQTKGHALPISLLILRKKPTVLQSNKLLYRQPPPTAQVKIYIHVLYFHFTHA